MKVYYQFTFFLFLTLTACSDDDDRNIAPVDQLPPITQEGKNTIGCLVNGEALLPFGRGGRSGKQAFYQFVDGEYYLGISFTNEESLNRSIGIFANEICENKIYHFKTPDFSSSSSNNQYGNYLDRVNSKDYFTNEELEGELKILRLDEENQIISGTFWFDAINEAGEIVEIREGRFDMVYTR